MCITELFIAESGVVALLADAVEDRADGAIGTVVGVGFQFVERVARTAYCAFEALRWHWVAAVEVDAAEAVFCGEMMMVMEHQTAVVLRIDLTDEVF